MAVNADKESPTCLVIQVQQQHGNADNTISTANGGSAAAIELDHVPATGDVFANQESGMFIWQTIAAQTRAHLLSRWVKRGNE